MSGCQRIPQRRHVKLVAISETGNTGLKKGPGLHALSRSLCHEVCPVTDCICSALVVPRQEEISGAATGRHVILYQSAKFYPNSTTLSRKK